MHVVIRRKDGVIVEHTIDGVNVIGTQTSTSVRRTGVDARVPANAKMIAPEPWPLALLPLKLLAKEGDRGAGDIIARVVGPIGGDAFKTWYKKIFGKSCGCGARQDVLNSRWPL